MEPTPRHGTTTTWQLPFPSQTDPADVPTDIKALCDRLEVVLSQLKSGGAIPGEIRSWFGATVPEQATYGRWVWADGTSYVTAQFPIAASHIDPAWRTFGGAADPGGSNFRVPDLRGLILAALDQMPGGTRANRVTRAAAAALAGRLGEELHTLAQAEMPSHGHTLTDPGHSHGLSDPGHYHGLQASNQSVNLPGTGAPGGYGGGFMPSGSYGTDSRGTGQGVNAAQTGQSVQANGGGGAHENMPPSVFVPYIVKLDD